MFSVYILECGDGSLYTGYTNNIDRRLKQHQSGKGSKYTRARLPVTLVYLEYFISKEEAMKREWYIKHKMTRKQKLELIENWSSKGL